MISIQVTSSHVKPRQVTASHSPISHGNLIIAVIKLHARSATWRAARGARGARGVFPLDIIPLVLPVPGRKLDQHQAHILLVLRDRIKSSDGPPKVL
jgi:hypothetical protein